LLQKENEELIDKIAYREQTIDKKDDELRVLTRKKNDYKLISEQLKDKVKSMDEILEKSEQSKTIEVKQMEERIEARVSKIILQKE